MTPEDIRRVLNPGPSIFEIMWMMILGCISILVVVMTVCLSYKMIRDTLVQHPQSIEAPR